MVRPSLLLNLTSRQHDFIFLIGVSLLLLLIIAFILYRKKRRTKDKFDGNFNPTNIDKHGPNMGGGTLPQVHIEDDGMGGRLGPGAVGGGVISPFPFASSHSANPSSTRPNMHMGNFTHSGAATAAAYANDQSHHQRTPSSASIGQYANYFPQQQQTQYNPYEPQFTGQTVSAAATGTTTSMPNGVMPPTPYASPFGRGPSPGHSMLDNYSQGRRSVSETTSSAAGLGAAGASLGINPKEVEAMGGNPSQARIQRASPGTALPHVANPDEFGQMPGGYFQHGTQNQYYTAVQPPMGGIQAVGSQMPQERRHSVMGVPSVGQSPPPPQAQPQPQPQPQPQHVIPQHIGRVEDHDALDEVPPPYDSLPEEVRQ